MSGARTAFRFKQVVPSILVEQMRTFRFDSAGTIVNHFGFADQISVVIDFGDLCAGIDNHITSSVHIRKQRRINAVNI